MAQANIKAVITAEDKASAALTGFGNKVAGVGSKIASAMKVAAVAAGAATAALITFSLNQFRDIQKNVAGVQALTKNTNEARKALKNAIDFVQGKPFDRLDTIGATKQLLAFGRTTNQIKGDLKTLGNTVLISGIQWQDVTRVYGRVVASGKLLREDFNILNDAGVGLAKTLQDELGTNMQGVFDKMEDGEISAEIFQRALKKAAPDSATEKALNTFDNKLLSLKAKFRDIGFAILGVDFNQLSETGEPLVKEGGLLDRLTDGMDTLTMLLSGPVKNSFGQLGQSFTAIKNRALDLIEGGIAFLKRSFDILSPSITALWNVIRRDLVPVLMRLWKEVLEPLMPLIGVIFVANLYLLANALRVVVVVSSRIVNIWLNLVAGAKRVINIIKELVDSLFSGSGAWAKFRDGALRALGPIRTIVGGIVKAVDFLIDKLKESKELINHIKSNVGEGAKRGLINSIPGAEILRGIGFASGGFTGQGNNNQIAGVVHKGEYVVPKQHVDQNRGVPKMGAVNNFNVYIGMYAGTEQEKRKIAEGLMRSFQDSQSANPGRTF